MSCENRREFLGRLGFAALALPAALARAEALQSGASFSYDLLIAGGRVIDPAQNLSAERDVAILGGKIARVDVKIPRDTARQIFDATGKIVTPGVVDLHTHDYQYGTAVGMDPDVIGIQSGITTVVDAGSAGAANFPGFRKHVIDVASTRVYALLNISAIGVLVVTDQQIGLIDPNVIDRHAAIRTVLANRDRILGVKVLITGTRRDLAREVPVVTAAREVADATGVPIMMHWTVEPELLQLLRKGDILTHPFNPVLPTTAPNAFSNLFGGGGAQADRVVPQILALQERGIWTDGQLGNTHHSWEVSEKALRLGWIPDVLSSDIVRTPDGVSASLLVSMSQYLHLGLSLERVVACVTANPARVLAFPEKLGTLEPGATADVTVLELAKGRLEFPDTVKQTRVVTHQLLPVATVKGGIFVKGAPAVPAATGAVR